MSRICVYRYSVSFIITESTTKVFTKKFYKWTFLLIKLIYVKIIIYIRLKTALFKLLSKKSRNNFMHDQFISKQCKKIIELCLNVNVKRIIRNKLVVVEKLLN